MSRLSGYCQSFQATASVLHGLKVSHGETALQIGCMPAYTIAHSAMLHGVGLDAGN